MSEIPSWIEITCAYDVDEFITTTYIVESDYVLLNTKLCNLVRQHSLLNDSFDRLLKANRDLEEALYLYASPKCWDSGRVEEDHGEMARELLNKNL